MIMWFILVLINVFVIVSAQNQSQQNSENGIDLRIFQGQYAQYGQFPWMVYINANGGGFCGGSLISPSWILTAAECIKDVPSFSLFIGANKTNPRDPRSMSLTANISIIHSGYMYYDYTHIENNIGLIKLHYPISETEYIKPLRLPQMNAGSFEGASTFAMGWGITGTDNSHTKVTYTRMSVISNNECKKTFPSILDSELCCKSDIQQTPAEGDYGGPLIIYQEDGTPTIIGIISFYLPKKELPHNSPSGYTRVSSFLSWIHEKTGIVIGNTVPILHFNEDFAWMVYIQTNDGESCAGSLISSTWILTTADCVRDKTSFTIAAGSSSFPGSRNELRTTNLSMIPDKFQSAGNLIGLIKLLEPIYENHFVKYIRLPTINAASYEGGTAIVLGWRKMNNLNALTITPCATLELVSNQECQKTYSTITDYDICYRGDLSKTASQGTKGGPLIIYEVDGQPTIIGLIKFSSGKDQYLADVPSGFIRLVGIMYWIHEQTGISFERLPDLSFDEHFPWMVYIRTNDGAYCAGSLISSTWILTTADCIRGKTSFTISVGSIGLSSSKALHRTSNISIVPDASIYSNAVNTIGLIKLLDPIYENDFVKYIRLPMINSGSFEGTTGMVIGWDITNDINTFKLTPYATLEIVSNNECKKTYSQITDYDICYRGDLSTTVAQGAHGGPLIINEKDGKPTIIGLLSFPSQFNQYSTNAPSGFIRLTNFLYWIHEETNISIEGVPVLNFDVHFPWMVYIKADGGEYCGGSLISSTWVLTTADCIRDKNSFTIAAGTSDLPGSKTILRKSNISIIPETFMYSYNDNTIGLIKLFEPIYETGFIKHLRLPAINAGNFEDNTGIVIGWTVSNKFNALKLTPYATLEIVSNNECKQTYKQITDYDLCYKGDLSPTMAQGAHGGPLVVYEKDGLPTIIGVIKFPSQNDNTTQAPSGFIRLSSFLYWIHEITGILIVGLPVLHFEAQFPWMVYIVKDDGDFCVGVLISSTWILTTADCIMDTTSLMIGIGAPKENNPDINGIFLKPNKTVTHEGYKYFKDSNKMNNIGLLNLANPISKTPFSKPIKLPKLHSKNLEGTPAVTLEWKKPESSNLPKMPKARNVKIIPNDDCKQIYGPISDTNLCVKPKSDNIQDTPSGPLIEFDDNGEPIIIGLMNNRPQPKGLPNNAPEVYSKVSIFLDWINKITGIETADDVPMLEFDKRFPWIVYIQDDDGNYFGGSLISKSWILTDADCIKGKSSFLIATGATQQNHPNSRTGYKTANISLIHNGFKSTENGITVNNLGLIGLLEPIEESDVVRPIRLPKINAGTFEGNTAIPISWNLAKNADLLKIKAYPGLHIAPNRKCKHAYSEISDLDLCYNGSLSQPFTQGSHGSSLIVYEDDGQPTIIGLINFLSARNGDPNNIPNGFIRLATYLHWIQVQTGIVIEFPSIYFNLKFPWTVYIIAENGEYCGGVLISRTWILTAAECIKDMPSFAILTGSTHENNLGSVDKLLKTNIGIKHEGYKYFNEDNIENNIGLIKLHKPIPENGIDKPINLPKLNSRSDEGVTATAFGWGISNGDKSLTVPTLTDMDVVSNQKCKRMYPHIAGSNLCCQVYLTAEQGTKGSPLIKYEDGKPILIGLSSLYSTKNKYLTNSFLGFTRLSNYLDWIQEKTDIKIEEESPTLHFLEEFPWMVYIRADDSDYFGGVLISTSWIATAALCIIDKNTFSIVTGSTNAKYPNSDEKFLKTSTSIIHEGYKYISNLNIVNNIGLIRLNEPIIPNDLAKPIRLPKVDSRSLEDTPAIIVGWSLAGTANLLKLVSNDDVDIISNEECKRTYSSITAADICCKGEMNHTTVKGDYGNALIVKEKDGKDTFIGIMSFYSASIKFSASSPVGFTKIGSFLIWIHKKTAIPIEYAITCRTDQEQMEFETCYNTCSAHYRGRSPNK